MRYALSMILIKLYLAKKDTKKYYIDNNVVIDIEIICTINVLINYIYILFYLNGGRC